MKKIVLNAIFVCLALTVIVYPACTPTQTTANNPSLPPGLTSINLPDISLNGFVYVNQGQTFILPGGTVPGIEHDFGLNSASVFLGPDEDSVGGMLTVASGNDVKAILAAIGKQTDIWAASSGNNIFVSLSKTDWDKSLQGTLTGNKTVPALTAYADAFQTLSYFPSNPPEKPLAGGFLDIRGELSASFAGVDSNINTVIQAIKAVNINVTDFILYGPNITKVPAKLDETVFNDYNVLLVGKSGFSTALLNVSFDTLIRNAGLAKIDLNGVTAYSCDADGMQVFIARKGDIIYAALASSESAASTLLLSAVK
jgi:hypothetical protein